MPITRTAWIDDDGSGTTGTILNNAEKTILYDQIDAAIAAVAPGARYDIPYAASNFSGSGSMVWTVTSGMQVTFGYTPIAKLAFVLLDIANSTVSGAAGSPLNVVLPLLPTRSTDTVGWATNNGAVISVRVRIVNADPTVRLYPMNVTGNWDVSAGLTNVSAQFVVPI